MFRIAPPDFFLRALARQLSGPSGPLGSFIARGLNKGNRGTISAAVDALSLSGDETVADIGYGGGVGLELLLDRLPSGTVHGVEPSHDMHVRARRARAAEVEAGRLVLHEASMHTLPFTNGSLDGWISLNTIYFIATLPPSLAELARVLAADGTAVLGIADPDWMAEQPFTRHEFTLRPVAEVVTALEAAGLTVEVRALGDRAMPYHLLVCRHA